MVYTINTEGIALQYDPAKNQENIARRGISFEKARELDWDTALIREDARKNYGEVRLQVMAMLEERLHIAIVTQRGEGLRIISLRKANEKEQKYYAEAR